MATWEMLSVAVLAIILILMAVRMAMVDRRLGELTGRVEELERRQD